jgi:hypothetical protein
MSPDESQDPARPGEWTSPVPQDAEPGIHEIPEPNLQPYGGYPVAPHYTDDLRAAAETG